MLELFVLLRVSWPQGLVLPVFLFYHFNGLVFITLLVAQWCQEGNKSSRHSIHKAGEERGQSVSLPKIARFFPQLSPENPCLFHR